MKNTTCPLRQNDWCNEKCEWFNDTFEKCIIHLMEDSLSKIADRKEDIIIEE